MEEKKYQIYTHEIEQIYEDSRRIKYMTSICIILGLICIFILLIFIIIIIINYA